MLGNDVVDLRDPETHTRHPSFDARVFTETERRSLDASPDPHAMRQMLWAAKESAYKAARRRDPRVVFSPIRFETVLDGIGMDEGRAENQRVIEALGLKPESFLARPYKEMLEGTTA